VLQRNVVQQFLSISYFACGTFDPPKHKAFPWSFDES
jgi:hypothetical protein